MKKRLICALLAAVMLFGMISMVVVSVSAASTMKASESVIAMIKQLEGFQSVPKLDYSQYSVGYGSACDQGDYPTGITLQQADALLRNDIEKLETKVNNFADNNGLTFTQAQFDALISFTYNVGHGWMSDTEGAFRSAVVNGSKGNDFLFAITRWSTAGVGDNKSVQTGLVQRRLAEANLYLNGVYSTGVPANYTYVLYNTNIANCTNSIRIQAYDTTVGDTVKAVPTKSGYDFLGWYTAAEGGKQVTKLNASTARANLYAHWQKGAGAMDTSGNVNGVAANYVVYGAAGGTQVVREQPKADAKALRTLTSNEEVTVVADYMDSTGTKWGKLSGGGWISLGEASAEMQPAEVFDEPLTVTVTTNGVNIRFGPGTNHTKVGTASKGQLLSIVGVQKGGQYLWGKFSDGWICLDYTNYETAKSESSAATGEMTAVGTVIRTNKLTVRSGPGTSYASVGSLKGGATFQITNQQTVKGKVWYKCEAGWVHSYYVQVTQAEAGDVPETTDPSTETTAPTENKIAVGTVIRTNKLNVRSGPGTGYASVGSLKGGATIEITGQQTVKGTVWYKFNSGWVHSYYVKATEVAADEVPETTAPSVETTAPSTETTAPSGSGDGSASGGSQVVDKGVIYNCDELRIRAAAGTNNACVGTVARGTQVEILGYTVVRGATWGKIAKGWIHMNYVKLLDVTSDADGVVGTVVKCTKVNVRSGAGTSYAKVGQLAAGTQVQVLQLMELGNGKVWARTSKGWIHTDYLKLSNGEVADDTTTENTDSTNSSANQGATDTTVDNGKDIIAGSNSSVTLTGAIVKTSSLRVRRGPGVSYEHVADLKAGDKVEILELYHLGNTTWGRTAKGWISLYYVQLDAIASANGAVIKTVTATKVDVRGGAGESFEKLGTYQRNNKVIILEQTTVGDDVWGRTELGWIPMDQVK